MSLKGSEESMASINSQTKFHQFIDLINYPGYPSKYYLEEGHSNYKSKLTLICAIPALLMMITTVYLLIVPLITQQIMYTEIDFDETPGISVVKIPKVSQPSFLDRLTNFSLHKK